jgi:threonine aldolase
VSRLSPPENGPGGPLFLGSPFSSFVNSARRTIKLVEKRLGAGLSRPMWFASDNWAGAAPQIVDAIALEAQGFAAAYGVSDTDRAIEAKFSDLFEREVAVFFVATGTAANSLGLAAVSKPGGAVFCHREAHIVEDECGAVEFQTGGARLMQLDGEHGKLAPHTLDRAISRLPPDFVHAGQPMAVSITQATEAGTVYAIDEIREIAEVACRYGLPLHMDGSRFANALVHLGVSPAAMTWQAGVDILSFGATKNGCVCAEALIFFDPREAADLLYMRKRAGHLFSKTRFVAAQFHAYLADDLWLQLARHANRMADRLREGLAQTGEARLAWPTQANEVFVILGKARAKALRERGAKFHDWPQPLGTDLGNEDEVLVRLVTNFATELQEVEAFLRALEA